MVRIIVKYDYDKTQDSEKDNFFSLLLTITLSAFAQKTIDFTTYDVIAKAGDVTVIVKDNDYRMVVGSLKKPKLNMLMGYTKEQAASKIDRILDFSKEGYTKKNRNVSVCGVLFLLTITGEGDNETYHFEASDLKGKFDLSVKDCKQFKKAIQEQQ